jgi:hypothetical protein
MRIPLNGDNVFVVIVIYLFSYLSLLFEDYVSNIAGHWGFKG